MEGCTSRSDTKQRDGPSYAKLSAMDFAKLTQMSRQAVTEAQSIARRHSHNEVDTWHLLAALLAQENGIVPGLLDKMSIAPSAVQLAVERELERLPKVSG